MNKIVAASQKDVYAITGERDAQVLCAKIMYRGQRVIALGGIAKVPGDERAWAWLDAAPVKDIEGVKIIRAARAALHEFNQTVYLQCDGAHAFRFLRLLGFVPTDEKKLDQRTGMSHKEVWVWRHWPL